MASIFFIHSSAFERSSSAMEFDARSASMETFFGSISRAFVAEKEAAFRSFNALSSEERAAHTAAVGLAEALIAEIFLYISRRSCSLALLFILSEDHATHAGVLSGSASIARF